MRKSLKLIVPLLLIVSALIIVPPRVWVKNKKAKLTYDGRISENLNLFHGSDGRVLFYLPDQDRTGVYIYTPETGLWRCPDGFFVPLKLIALSKRFSSGCGVGGAGGDEIHSAIANNQSIEFTLHDIPVVVSWQAAPR